MKRACIILSLCLLLTHCKSLDPVYLQADLPVPEARFPVMAYDIEAYPVGTAQPVSESEVKALFRDEFIRNLTKPEEFSEGKMVVRIVVTENREINWLGKFLVIPFSLFNLSYGGGSAHVVMTIDIEKHHKVIARFTGEGSGKVNSNLWCNPYGIDDFLAQKVAYLMAVRKAIKEVKGQMKHERIPEVSELLKSNKVPVGAE